ncbi:MAG TPA: hypothetical protein VG735_03755 [Caulobacterales bacterium]|jgi:hypothetical protein|nr:hypothetical protein [Caulobacterales bacterium]
MAVVEVRDFVIWPKHIHGDPALSQTLLALRQGDTVELVIDGFRGAWRKMDDQPDGKPTPGIRPVAAMKMFWSRLYRERRGETVDLKLSGASPAEALDRQAALQALLSLGGLGWRSQEPYGERDELHDR